MATYGAAPEDGGIHELFEASPAREVHTSAAAETSFLVGLVAALAAPFSVTAGLSLATGVLATVFGVVGIATTSRPNVAGRLLTPVGLFLAFIALTVVGLRYLGVETAFGDGLVPTLREWLDDLNSRLPLP
ncbi:MAG: hypothetical protein M3237_22615 [Actinomycetota bacterium]|nr:hypothetical protein [Actinomycetota bacterium]